MEISVLLMFDLIPLAYARTISADPSQASRLNCTYISSVLGCGTFFFFYCSVEGNVRLAGRVDTMCKLKGNDSVVVFAFQQHTGRELRTCVNELKSCIYFIRP